MDDQSLLDAWHLQRNDDALRNLCERHGALVRAAAVRASSPDPDETTQAVFILLTRRAGSLSGSQFGGRPGAELYRAQRERSAAAATSASAWVASRPPKNLIHTPSGRRCGMTSKASCSETGSSSMDFPAAWMRW